MCKELTIPPELGDKLVSGLVEQCGHIVIEWVHVLHQPFISLVVNLKEKLQTELSTIHAMK